MLGQKLQGDHAAQRVADKVSFVDLQVIEQEHDILDNLKAVGFVILGPVRVSVPRHVEGDDLVILGEFGDDTGHLPVDFGARMQPVDQDDRFALSFDKEMNLHSLGIEASGPCFIGSQDGVGLGEKRQNGDDPDQTRKS